MPEPRVTAALRLRVFERALGACEYCRTPDHFCTEPCTLDHVQPRSTGGETRESNLALACHGCNSHIHARLDVFDPVSRVRAPLFNPRVDNWENHFAWSPDFQHLVGLTPTGRGSVVALRLNRPGLIGIRRALLAIREHPAGPLET